MRHRSQLDPAKSGEQMQVDDVEDEDDEEEVDADADAAARQAPLPLHTGFSPVASSHDGMAGAPGGTEGVHGRPLVASTTAIPVTVACSVYCCPVAACIPVSAREVMLFMVDAALPAERATEAAGTSSTERRMEKVTSTDGKGRRGAATDGGCWDNGCVGCCKRRVPVCRTPIMVTLSGDTDKVAATALLSAAFTPVAYMSADVIPAIPTVAFTSTSPPVAAPAGDGDGDGDGDGAMEPGAGVHVGVVNDLRVLDAITLPATSFPAT